MSHTKIYRVPAAGPVSEHSRYPNSWGSAAYIWVSLCNAHYGLPGWSSLPDIQLLWDLAKHPAVPRHQQIALKATFDMVMVRRENLGEVIEAFGMFYRDFPPGDHACSIPAQSENLRVLFQDPDCFAVCWQQTTTCRYLWQVPYNEDSRPYDLARDEGHWFLFDEESK